MRFNRIILAISCGAGLALVGACSDNGSHLTSPANRAPSATATKVDTFITSPKLKTQSAPVDTFITSPKVTTQAAPVDTFIQPQH